MRALVLLIVLSFYWWLLSGRAGIFFVGTGVVCVLFTLYICARLKLIDSESVPLQALPGMLFYLPWLLWQVLVANIHVARIVWSPNLDVQPQMLWVPHKLKTGFGESLYANSITLTPGTVTVDVTDDEILAHALTDETARDLKSGTMHDWVAHIEGSAAPSADAESGSGPPA